MVEFARKHAVKSNYGINLTPLIDVIFLLIVFFLLTSEFISIQAIEMQLSSVSEVSESTLTNEDTPIVITLTESNKFASSGESKSIDELGAFLHDIEPEKKNRIVLLNTGDAVMVNDIVKAIEQIKKTGFENIALNSLGGN